MREFIFINFEIWPEFAIGNNENAPSNYSKFMYINPKVLICLKRHRTILYLNINEVHRGENKTVKLLDFNLDIDFDFQISAMSIFQCLAVSIFLRIYKADVKHTACPPYL